MDQKLTKAQKKVVATIRDLIQKTGKAPTLEEIRKAMGYSSIYSVQRHLAALKKKGVVSSEKHQSRSLELNLESEEKINIPLVGNIAAGKPLLAEENIEAYIPYKKSELRGELKSYFFLRAVGDSMDKAGIDDGDFVLVRQQQTANVGKPVVALVGDEATVKKLKKGDGFYILEPESTNPQNKPLYLFEDFSIQGVVYDVIKKGDVQDG
jgi:repressor LexA